MTGKINKFIKKYVLEDLISENFIETSYLLDIDTIIVLFLQVVRFEYRAAWKISFC